MLFKPEALRGMPPQPGMSEVVFHGVDWAKPQPDVSSFAHFGTNKLLGKGVDFMILDDPHAGPNAKPVKEPKKDYNTVGCRFLRGSNLHKIYTYRVRKGAKVHLGQELVAETETGDTVVVVVEIHTKPQDNGPYAYKFLTKKVAQL